MMSCKFFVLYLEVGMGEAVHAQGLTVSAPALQKMMLDWLLKFGVHSTVYHTLFSLRAHTKGVKGTYRWRRGRYKLIN